MALFSWIVRRKRDFPIEFVDSAIAALIKVHGRGHRRSIAYSRQTFEFRSCLLDSAQLVGRLDCPEPQGLLGDLVNVPVIGFGGSQFLAMRAVSAAR
jgi:hypothetical protein